jgi:hypothetical protein
MLTARQWDAADDNANNMIDHLSQTRRTSDRKNRLFACAAWRGRSVRFRNEDDVAKQLRIAELGEKMADGASPSSLSARLSHDYCPLVKVALLGARQMAASPATAQEAVTMCAMIRDIFGDPFSEPPRLPRVIVGRVDAIDGGTGRPLRKLPSAPDRYEFADHAPCLTPDVKELAHAVYSSQEKDGTLDPVGLSALADALEEAGLAGERVYLCNNQGKHYHKGEAGQTIHGEYHATDPHLPHHHHDEKCAFDEEPHPLLCHLRGYIRCTNRCRRAPHRGPDLREYLLPGTRSFALCPCRTRYGYGRPRTPLRHWRGCWALDLALEKQ